jgi:hypothetical protein
MVLATGGLRLTVGPLEACLRTVKPYCLRWHYCNNDSRWLAAPQEVGDMTKPGPKSGGDHSEEREAETAKTLWFLAGQGNQGAKDAVSDKTGEGDGTGKK